MVLLFIEKNRMTHNNNLPTLTTLSPFEPGKWLPNAISVKTSSTSAPPKPLYIVFPDVPSGMESTFPVLLFLHGFLIPNTCYSSLLQHVSSHGYIVVAPGLDLMDALGNICICSALEDVESLADVTNWLNTDKGGLKSVLPSNVRPDFNNLALAGHSKGGKAAFALALNYNQTQTTLNYKALIGLDPVAGPNTSSRIQPKILTYIPHTFNFSIPVAVIGTGLGDDSLGCFPAAAPFGCNHPEFFKASKPPSCYFLAKDYGHCDMLDEWIAKLAGLVFKSGNKARDEMRKGCGGIIVAFLKAYLEDETKYLEEIVSSPGIAPIRLDPVLWVQK